MSGVNVPAHYYTQYSQNVALLLQQLNSRLSGLVDTGTHSGEKASPVDQVGKAEMSDVVGRFQPMGRKDLPADRRWVFPTSSDFPQLVDSFDMLKLLTDPKSKYVQAAGAAGNRRKDRHVINNFFADAKIGVDATGTEQFGTALTTAGTPGQNVGVNVGGAASGLNVAKMKEGKRRLMEADIDLDVEPIYMGATSKEHDALLGEIQVISTDFNDKPVLTEGRVTRFLGINIVHSELFNVTATDDQSGTSRQIPLWGKNGMHLGTWSDLKTDISQRNDLQGLPWQAYVWLTMGATRTELQRVIRIWCR